MKLGEKNIESLLMAAMTIHILIAFLVIWGGIVSGNPKSAVISMGLLIISAAQIIISMLLVRLYALIKIRSR